MKKALYFTAAVSFATVSIQAQANDLITLEAIKVYAAECYNQGGISYISRNNGASWSVLNAEEASRAAKHSKGLAIINARMNGEKVSEEQLTQYLDTQAHPKAIELEKSKTLHCEGGSTKTSGADIATMLMSIPDGDWSSTQLSGKDYNTLNADGDRVKGFGRIRKDNGYEIFAIYAECSEAGEPFTVSEVYSTSSKKIIRPSENIAPNKSSPTLEIKHEICTEQFGKSYIRYQ